MRHQPWLMGLVVLFVATILLGGVTVGLWSWLKGRFGKKAEKEKPLISLVLLLREPRSLDTATLARLAGDAWGTKLATDKGDATDFVVGDSPLFIIQCKGYMFLVNNFPKPYVENPEAVAEEMKELRLRKAMGEHRAWLSVDLLGEADEVNLKEAYRYIGKLVANLMNDDCLAIYAPSTQRLNICDADLKEKLRGPHPLEAITDLTNPPVVQVGEDDPRMKAAVAEARRRFPEFVTAFKQRRSGWEFYVKAPFTDDTSTEFMWAEVTRIENDIIHGTLSNEPVSVKNLRLGDPVQVKLSDLNDWTYTDGKSLTGGFTIKVLDEASKGHRSGR